jgi:hypothetical protein
LTAVSRLIEENPHIKPFLSEEMSLFLLTLGIIQGVEEMDAGYHRIMADCLKTFPNSGSEAMKGRDNAKLEEIGHPSHPAHFITQNQTVALSLQCVVRRIGGNRSDVWTGGNDVI